MFPDCPGVTAENLRHLGNYTGLESLTINGVPASLFYVQDGQKDPGDWIQRLPESLKKLDVTGELQ